MIEKIKVNYPIFNRYSNFDTEELTSLELAGRTTQKVNEIIDLVNGVDGRIVGKEDSTNITVKRKLSATGNFTGSLNGSPVSSVLTDLSSALSLSQTIISLVNARESIGTIFDGGVFLETDPPTFDIEGGLF